MSSVELMTPDGIKEADKARERELIDTAELETAWLSRNVA